MTSTVEMMPTAAKGTNGPGSCLFKKPEPLLFATGSSKSKSCSKEVSNRGAKLQQ